MTFKGRVKDGVVVLEEGTTLEDGTEVRVEPVPHLPGQELQPQIPTLYDQLRPLIGKAKGLPSDLAENHDHYLHGRPRK